ncbi:MAG: hypothetical protein GF308_07800 [Candidatus Heimdallarchaeota archaeon]|nr:hypothetical protein [Candidatus Heimdallarchaeota archaeon]
MTEKRQYLFTAEADKIQDLLFSSSKLREVAGGSQMLAEFCEKAVIEQFLEQLVGGGSIILSGGGTFRILFDSREKAEKCSRYLPEFYRRVLGGTITVAELLPVFDQQEAIDQAQTNLMKAKHLGKITNKSPVQTPYLSICNSCGLSIADGFNKYEEELYSCERCSRKAEARKKIKEKFLKKFVKFIDYPDKKALNFPEETDEVAELDKTGRQYVAYIVADGNGMGTIFSRCKDFEELTELSDKLEETINRSLSIPTDLILERIEALKNIPVFPLILGGDDLFILLPAQWALDFTLRFCRKFEEQMATLITDIGLAEPSANISPTISAGVVICKGKFPYLSAYELGNELLYTAKKVGKEDNCSTVAFTLITGSSVVKTSEAESTFQSSYPVYSLDELKQLIDMRLTLKDLPRTRKEQLEALFYKAEAITKFDDLRSKWLPERETLVNRLSKELKPKILKAFQELGSTKEDHNWIPKEGNYYHKLPDLLTTWDYLYNLEKKTSEYFEEKRV